jgi:hypothetical protein
MKYLQGHRENKTATNNIIKCLDEHIKRTVGWLRYVILKGHGT